MKKDNNNLVVSTQNEKAINEINIFIQELLSSGQKVHYILKAASHYPDVLLIQCYAAIFHLYAQTNLNNTYAVSYLKIAEKSVSFVTHREKMFYYIVLAWQQHNYEQALTLLKAFINLYPQDLVAIKIAEWLYYCTGQAYQAKSFLSLCQTVSKYHKKNSHFLAIHAFALELSGKYQKSFEIANQALLLDFNTPWAHHALAHFYLIQGKIEQGIDALEMYQSSWDKISLLLKGHNAWHLALLYLAELKIEQALALCNSHIWGTCPSQVLQQMDMISYLWRLEIAGTSQTSRWKEVAKFMNTYPYEHHIPYNNAHYIYALVKTGNKKEANQIITDLENYAKKLGTGEYNIWYKVGKPLMQGCLAFADEDFKKASTCLQPIINEVFCVGGSDAQIDLFLQTYLLALINSHQKKQAKKFFLKYLSYYTHTPLGKTWLTKI